MKRRRRPQPRGEQTPPALLPETGVRGAQVVNPTVAALKATCDRRAGRMGS